MERCWSALAARNSDWRVLVHTATSQVTLTRPLFLPIYPLQPYSALSCISLESSVSIHLLYLELLRYRLTHPGWTCVSVGQSLKTVTVRWSHRRGLDDAVTLVVGSASQAGKPMTAVLTIQVGVGGSASKDQTCPKFSLPCAYMQQVTPSMTNSNTVIPCQPRRHLTFQHDRDSSK